MRSRVQVSPLRPKRGKRNACFFSLWQAFVGFAYVPTDTELAFREWRSSFASKLSRLAITLILRYKSSHSDPKKDQSESGLVFSFLCYYFAYFVMRFTMTSQRHVTLARTGTKIRDMTDINLMRISIAGPAVSLKGSPTVSPVIAAL